MEEVKHRLSANESNRRVTTLYIKAKYKIRTRLFPLKKKKSN